MGLDTSLWDPTGATCPCALVARAPGGEGGMCVASSVVTRATLGTSGRAAVREGQGSGEAPSCAPSFYKTALNPRDFPSTEQRWDTVLAESRVPGSAPAMRLEPRLRRLREKKGWGGPGCRGRSVQEDEKVLRGGCGRLQNMSLCLMSPN